jgi:hypothetical protein
MRKKEEHAVLVGGKVNMITTLLRSSSIETRVLKPTSFKGARIKAVLIGMNRKAVVNWDHSLDVAGNHCKAARALAAEWSENELAAYGDGHRVAHLNGCRTINGWCFQVIHRNELNN